MTSHFTRNEWRRTGTAASGRVQPSVWMICSCLKFCKLFLHFGTHLSVAWICTLKLIRSYATQIGKEVRGREPGGCSHFVLVGVLEENGRWQLLSACVCTFFFYLLLVAFWFQVLIACWEPSQQITYILDWDHADTRWPWTVHLIFLFCSDWQ